MTLFWFTWWSIENHHNFEKMRITQLRSKNERTLRYNYQLKRALEEKWALFLQFLQHLTSYLSLFEWSLIWIRRSGIPRPSKTCRREESLCLVYQGCLEAKANSNRNKFQCFWLPFRKNSPRRFFLETFRCRSNEGNDFAV